MVGGKKMKEVKEKNRGRKFERIRAVNEKKEW